MAIRLCCCSPACASFDQFRDFEHRGIRIQALLQAHRPTKRGCGGAGLMALLSRNRS